MCVCAREWVLESASEHKSKRLLCLAMKSDERKLILEDEESVALCWKKVIFSLVNNHGSLSSSCHCLTFLLGRDDRREGQQHGQTDVLNSRTRETSRTLL